MFYKKNEIEISFTSVVTDFGIRGIRIEKDSSEKIELFDDPTESYRTWDKTYDEIFDELYECWLNRIKVKKYTMEAFSFERNVGRELDRQTRRILDLSWKPKGYFEFKVYHPVRIISAPYYEDRIVEEWLTDTFIKPYVEPKIHPNNIACQDGKGPPVGQNYFKEILPKLQEKYGDDFYFVQFDIQGYFDNVCHARIKEQFAGMQALGFILFCNIIDDWKKKGGYASQEDPEYSYGVPKGNLPSQWIGFMYLNEIDWYISGREDCLGFVRYMDDFIAFFEKKSSCKDCKIKVEKILNDKRMGIRLHPRKTVYAPIRRSFTFCGWHYELLDNGEVRMRVKEERKKITKRRFQNISEKYYTGDLSFSDVRAKVNGTYAFFKQGNTRGLQKYLSNRYRFTHDPDTFYKEKHSSQKKRNKKKNIKEKGERGL